MGGGEDSEDNGEEDDAGTPLAFGALEGVGDSNGGVDGGEEAECSPDFVIGCSGGGDDGRRETVKGEGDVSAGVAVEAAGDPPEAGSEEQGGEGEGKAQQQVDVADFVAHFPGGGSGRLAGQDALDGEREAGGSVGEGSVVDVAAGGEVSGEGRGLLPDFAAAAGVGVVGVRKRVVVDDPKALREKDGEQHGGDLLRAVEAEFA